MRVLFVDDEVRVLEGLERGLMGVVDDDCELAFAASGAEALALLAEGEFDVVVTDMRMPVMDGAALLERVHERHPDTVRLILSGQMEADAAMRATSVAHQFLTKPSSAESIYALLRSTHRLRELIGSPVFRRAVGQVDRLPPVPEVYRALQAELARPELTLRRVAAVVERDAALAAKLLHIANSAYFAGQRKISSLTEAVTRLGVGLIQALALSTAFDAAQAKSLERFELRRIQERAMQAALLARTLTPASADVVFTASLLADCGALVLAVAVPDELAAVWSEADAAGRPRHEVERGHWGIDHAAVGAYLLALWGLPDPIVDAVAGHHAAAQERRWSSASAAVRVATAIVDGEPPEPALVELLGVADEIAAPSGGASP